MEISYELTRTDFYDAFIAHRNNSRRIWVYGSLAVSNLALLIACFVVSPERSLLTGTEATVFLAVLWAWVLWGQPWWAARNQYVKQPAAHGSKTAIFDGAGVHYRGTGGSGEVLWKAYIRNLESKRHFLLYFSPVAFNIIPKRGLTSEQTLELRRILEEHIRSGN